jgi:integrase
MARAKIDLSVVRERDRLRPKSNRTPHWHRLRPGCFVGYRPTTDHAAGIWSAQAYVDGRRREKALGAFGEFAPSERFQKAKAAAEAFMAVEESGGRSRALVITVEDAARAYVAKGHGSAEEHFRLSVYPDPIGAIKLEKLRRQHLAEWLDRLKARPVARRKNAGKRAPASVNREMAPLRAALRLVLPPGQPNTEAAWQEAIKPISAKLAVRRRTLYLERQERQALLANISAEALPFAHALCLLPVRPGALAQLTVANLNKKTAELTIPAGIDKGHPERRIHVSAAAFALLAEQAKGKTPLAWLFTRADGKAWDCDYWKVPIREAALAAKLDPTTCAYTLRHSVITDLVNRGVATLTVAQLAGTSVKMIEDHYGHLLRDAAVEALDALAL